MNGNCRNATGSDTSISEPTTQQPVAWAFYQPDGRLRFIIDDKARMEAWRSAHQGQIVPLYPRPEERTA